MDEVCARGLDLGHEVLDFGLLDARFLHQLRQFVLELRQRPLLRAQQRFGGLEHRLDASALLGGERQFLDEALVFPPPEALRLRGCRPGQREQRQRETNKQLTGHSHGSFAGGYAAPKGSVYGGYAVNDSSFRTTTSTRLSGVDAPEVRPTRTGPVSGSQPWLKTSILSRTDTVPNLPGRNEALGVGHVEGRHLFRTDSGEIAGVAAVVAANDDHQIDRLLGQQLDDGVLPVLGGAADGVERPETNGQLGLAVARSHRRPEHFADFHRLGAQHRGLVGAADPFQMLIGVEPRGYCPFEARRGTSSDHLFR